MKKVLVLCMAVLMLSSMFVLTSCSLFGGIESEVEDLVNATSYTYAKYNSDGYMTQLVMVDMENLVLYTENYDGSKKEKIESSTYAYYDEDAGKYYQVICDSKGNPEIKTKIEEDMFFAGAREYAVAGTEMYKYTKLAIFMKEGEDELSYSAKNSNTTVTIYIDEEDQLCYEVKTGKTVITDIKYYDIDDTEIEIPEDVLSEKVSK